MLNVYVLPERRHVDIDCRLTVAGVTYEVDAELSGETVVVWWGLFDQELWVEWGEERHGPFLPAGGPIPLHRYRKLGQAYAGAYGSAAPSSSSPVSRFRAISLCVAVTQSSSVENSASGALAIISGSIVSSGGSGASSTSSAARVNVSSALLNKLRAARR